MPKDLKKIVAPIAIITYDRQAHILTLLQSLLKNPEASVTEILIFSDGAKTEKEKEKIQNLRESVRAIKGFKSIIIIAQPKNLGREVNAKCAISYVREKYCYFIVMEDDLEVSSEYLHHMNYCFREYYDCTEVQTIGGYNAPIQFSHNGQVKHRIINAWGIGYWSHKPFLEKLLTKNNFYEDMISSKNIFTVYRVHKYLHLYLRSMGDRVRKGDLIGTYLNCKFGWVQIRPSTSTVRNNGFDGSGQHCGVDPRFRSSDFLPLTKVYGNVKYSSINDQKYYGYFSLQPQTILGLLKKRTLSLIVLLEVIVKMQIIAIFKIGGK